MEGLSPYSTLSLLAIRKRKRSALLYSLDGLIT
jgi:hypothetical protein